MALSNNDIFRRLRYALRLDDSTMARIFVLGALETAVQDIPALLKKDTEEGFLPCNDQVLDAFLNGLVVLKRGERPDQLVQTPAATTRLNNNDILKKLRVALELRDDDVAAILECAGMRLGKTEIGALFRQAGHRNFKPCGDQVLRNFLTGLQSR